jgi:hypothetical protein
MAQIKIDLSGYTKQQTGKIAFGIDDFLSKHGVEARVHVVSANHACANPKKKVAAKSKVTAKKKRPINMAAIAGAIASPRTPKHLKEGLKRKYGAKLRAMGY